MTLPEAANDVIEEFVERNAIPGASIAISTASGSTFAGAYGHRDLATRAPATPDTSYLWFSLTKVVTATAVRMLADEGRLGLDDPAADHVPAPAWTPPWAHGAPAPQPHRGLLEPDPDPLGPSRRCATTPPPTTSSSASWPSTVARSIRSEEPVHYSNLGYLILGAVIEAAAGEPFPGYVRRAILRPLGMDRTDFVHTRPDLAATGYVKAPPSGRADPSCRPA